MTSPKPFFIHVLLLFVFLQSNMHAFSQTQLNDHNGWANRLSLKNEEIYTAYDELIPILAMLDSAAAFHFLHRLDAVADHSNSYFETRFICLTLNLRTLFQPEADHDELIQLTRKALNEAFKTEDESLIAFTYFICGTLMASIREMEYTVTYLLNGQEIYDRIGKTSSQAQYYDWIIIGEVLFHCGEYDKSIYYSHKGIDRYDDTSVRADYFRARFYNTIGQNYDRLNKLDSAQKYYEISLQLSDKVKDSVWIGINHGFIGDILFKKKEYDRAIPHLMINYGINKTGEYVHAAKSLQYMSRINLEKGRTDSALQKAQESLQIISKAGPGYYLQQYNFLLLVYQAAAEAFRASGKTDSFYHYNGLYFNLRDSLQKVAVLSSIKMTQLRIENENSQRENKVLLKEKRAEVMMRNFVIAGIVLVSIILFLYINRLRLKQSHKNQIAEKELISAREQMQAFTENIKEKTDLVEKLNQQLVDKELSSEQVRLVEEITNQTILTDEDWNKFRKLFERLYPGFFLNLKGKAQHITLAEQRMAALTRLNLTSRQIASMLGISVDSVHKTRQRLRQRLDIPNEQVLEETIAAL